MPGERLDLDARVRTEWVFDDIAPPQSLEMTGIVKAARYLAPADLSDTGDRHLAGTRQRRHATRISPVASAAEPEIAMVMENAA